MFSLENLPKHTYLKVQKDFREKLFQLFAKSYSHKKLDKLLKCDSFHVKKGENLWSIAKSTYGFFYFNKKYELIQHTQKVIKDVFENARIQIRKDSRTNVWKLATSTTVSYVISSMGGPKGNKVLTSFLIPKWILNGNIETKKSFLRALFDDEARPRKGMIELRLSKHRELKTNLIEFLKQIKQLLLDVGIDEVAVSICDYNKTRVRGKISITWQKNLKIFYENIGFLHPERSEKLKNILENYKVQQYRKTEAEKLALSFLKNKNLTTSELSKLLKRTPSRALYILCKIEKKNLVKRCGKKFPPGTIIWCKI